jgi:ligand-binding SRPBCC domain-containing protein
LRGRRATRWSFEVVSEVAADAATVWTHAVSGRGINRELAPLARMTLPGDGPILSPDEVVIGKRLFRSWILLGGLLPVDYDDLTLVELEPGRRFLESSPMLSQRVWRHERIVESSGDGCRVTDRVEFEPRIRLLGPLYAAVFRAAFRLRHRNLRRSFGARRRARDA